MKAFSSLDDLIQQQIEEGWITVTEPYGVRYVPPSCLGEGFMRVWGDPTSHCFVDSDCVFYEEQIERYYFRERNVKVSFVDEMDMVYYQKKSESAASFQGTYTSVNAVAVPWFKRFFAQAPQKVCSLFIQERFFIDAGVFISDTQWENAAAAINREVISFPDLALICQQIKAADVSELLFPEYLKAKALEAAAIIFSYPEKCGNPQSMLSERTRQAVREALGILSKSFVEPPTIENLARKVGVDKKTLQRAFQLVTGRSIGGYIQSLRMERAIALMEKESLRLEDISRCVGYLSKANFYKIFEKTYGCTPNELRKLIA